MANESDIGMSEYKLNLSQQTGRIVEAEKPRRKPGQRVPQENQTRMQPTRASIARLNRPTRGENGVSGKEGMKKEPKLSAGTIGLMVGTAILFDLVQVLVSLLHFIPLVGNVAAALGVWGITLLQFMTFWLWFKIHDVNFQNPKRLIGVLFGTFIEIVPLLSVLPGCTVAVVITIITTNAESLLEKVPGGDKVASGVKTLDRKMPRA